MFTKLCYISRNDSCMKSLWYESHWFSQFLFLFEEVSYEISFFRCRFLFRYSKCLSGGISCYICFEIQNAPLRMVVLKLIRHNYKRRASL